MGWAKAASTSIVSRCMAAFVCGGLVRHLEGLGNQWGKAVADFGGEVLTSCEVLSVHTKLLWLVSVHVPPDE